MSSTAWRAEHAIFLCYGLLAVSCATTYLLCPVLLPTCCVLCYCLPAVSCATAYLLCPVLLPTCCVLCYCLLFVSCATAYLPWAGGLLGSRDKPFSMHERDPARPMPAAPHGCPECAPHGCQERASRGVPRPPPPPHVTPAPRTVRLGLPQQ